MKKKLLITGFDPFGGEQVNPAFEAVRLLPDEIAGLELCKLEIPTEFIKSGVILKDALRAVHPNAVLCVGQAGGRTAVTPERVAINLMDARIPDNTGYQPIDTPVVPDGPAAFFSTLPVKAIAARIQSDGRGGFLHVPYAAEQLSGKPIGTFAMPLPDIARALTRAVEAISENL